MTDWPAVFRGVFATPVGSVEKDAGRAALGEEFPEELDTHSYLSWAELRDIAADTRVGAGDLLVDVGCGRGGPGLWVAAQTGASLLGVDIATTALDSARERAGRLGLTASFAEGSFAALPVADGQAAAIMSVDALLFAPDKAAALAELARALRPGGRLVFTTWDYHAQPVGRPPQVPDHRPLLQEAGFEVLRYDDTVDWHRRLVAYGDVLLARSDELAAQDGDDPDEVRASVVEMQATIETMIRRVYAVAERAA